MRRVASGSKTSVVAARAACPVAVVRREGELEGTRTGVVVAVDEAGHGQHAVEVGFQEASLRQTTLTAVHVWPLGEPLMSYGYIPIMPEEVEDHRRGASALLAEAVAGYATTYPDVAVIQQLIEGPVVDGLVDVSKTSQLLVMSRHGQARVGSLALGSVARSCLAHAQCPLVVTPASRPFKNRP